MAGSLSLMSQQARVFQCPKCKETIDASQPECRFCHAPIDAGAAEVAAEAMAKVNQACSDAGFLKVMAIALLVSFAFSFVPFVSFLGSLALMFLLFAIPAMLIRWWVKFGSLQTSEHDFSRARGIVIGLSIPGAFLPFIGLFLLFGMFVSLFGIRH